MLKLGLSPPSGATDGQARMAGPVLTLPSDSQHRQVGEEVVSSSFRESNFAKVLNGTTNLYSKERQPLKIFVARANGIKNK